MVGKEWKENREEGRDRAAENSKGEPESHLCPELEVEDEKCPEKNLPGLTFSASHI